MLFERFKEGTENINHNERGGRPNVVTSSHVAAVKAHLEKYRCTWIYPTYNRIHVDSGFRAIGLNDIGIISHLREVL